MRRWRNSHDHAPAAQPPVPTERHVCRWCGAKHVASTLDPDWVVCPNDCRMDASHLAERCEDCQHEFYTGKVFHVGDPRLCWGCEVKDAARYAERERYEGGAPRGFLKDEITRGASRRAHDATKDVA